MLTGQAAGTAAAQAIKDGTSEVSKLNVPKLQKTLEADGVKLHRTKEMEGNKGEPKKPNPNPPEISIFCVHNTKTGGSGH